jgi:RNA-binding protein 39
VLVSRINILANERDVYQFFAKGNVGKIRDVRLIRDQRSGKSKGYV